MKFFADNSDYIKAIREENDIWPEDPPIAEMIRQLEDAGWKQNWAHIWKSPTGSYFRGPCGAWRAMRSAKHDEPFNRKRSE